MKWSRFPLIIMLIVASGLGYQVWHKKSSPSSIQHTQSLLSGTYIASNRTLPTFTLTTHRDHPFTNENLNHHWSFVFFGYTRCPELCPRTLGIMRSLSQQLGAASHTQFVLMSIDPENDTQDYLKTYFNQPDYQHLPFIGVTGEAHQIQTLAQTLGIFVEEGGVPADQSHLEHSGTLLLFNPQGKLTALFNNPDDPKRLARDFQKVLQLEGDRI